MNEVVVHFPYTAAVAKTIFYPAGELQVRLTDETIAKIENADQIKIRARLTPSNFTMSTNIMTLLLLFDAIVPIKNDQTNVVLQLPYLPYARADRRFVKGDCFGLAAFSAVLRACEYDELQTLDVHSKAADNWVPRLRNITADNFFERLPLHPDERLTVLFPDAGALLRYSHLADKRNLPFAHATKKRDPQTGKFLSFEVPELPNTDLVLIVDDICDAGGTFLGIASAMRDKGYEGRFRLAVTHGIFSKGFDELTKYFEYIYTTNSLITDCSTYPVAVWDAFEVMEGIRV